VHDDPKFGEQDTPEEKMDKMCKDPALAGKYFRLLLDFLPSSDPYRDPANPFLPLQHGFEFDYRSIMIYDSHALADKFKTDDTSTWSIIAKKVVYPKYFPGLQKRIYTGGSEFTYMASVSALDVSRVAVLYPKVGPQQGATSGNNKRDLGNATVGATSIRNITTGNTTVGHWSPVEFVSLLIPSPAALLY